LSAEVSDIYAIKLVCAAELLKQITLVFNLQ